MIDPQFFREKKEALLQGLSNRGVSTTLITEAIECDEQWLKSLQKLESLKSDRKKATPKGKPSDADRAKLKALSEHIQCTEKDHQILEKKRLDLLLNLPNIPHADCPIGKDESDNKCLKSVGKARNFDFPISDHQSLLENLNALDLKKAANMSGSRFSILKGFGARLERALIQYMLDVHTQKFNYTEVSLPVLINEQSLIGTGQLPKFAEDLYHIPDSKLWLSPTGEVPLTNLVANSILSAEELPLKFTTVSPCFRKEAGSYGKDLSGIIRQHQFYKVELVNICHPKETFKCLEDLRNAAEYILESLELPYRVMSLCSGDLGFSAELTHDLEVWFPSQNCYREISSCSSFGDFQARRAMIRFSEGKEKHYVHTLNGSALAVGRTLAAIAENYQNKQGQIDIPKVLLPYFEKGVPK